MLLESLTKDSTARRLLAGLWVGTIAAALWFTFADPHSAVSRWIALCNPVPSDVVALLLLLPLLRKSNSRSRRIGWCCVFAAIACRMLANVGWAATPGRSHEIIGGGLDALYALHYPLLAAACAAFFIDLGGTFKTSRVWLDIATLGLGLGAIAALLLSYTGIGAVVGGSDGGVALASYTAGILSVEVLLALLFVQIMDWRNEKSILLFIASVILVGASDLTWATVRSDDVDFISHWLDVVGHYGSSALIATAALFERARPRLRAADTRQGPSRYSLLPILAVMISITLLLGLAPPAEGIEHWKLICFMLAVATLVTVRQLVVRGELHALHRALALREADARVSELVRNSTDLIAVVNPRGMLAYVSPACETLLGLRAPELRFTPARALIGAQNEDSMQRFLEEIKRNGTAKAEMHATLRLPGREPRSLHVVGSDQSHNPAIGGIALTLRDVTEQSRAEREVLDVAADERVRLAAGIHEGLGQDLAGIALLLQGLRSQSTLDPQSTDAHLDMIIGHVNRAIDLARQVAQGISPLQAARGSLSTALAKLAEDAGERYRVPVRFRRSHDADSIDPSVAEDLYRIAPAALGQALRHADCKQASLALERTEEEIALTVDHDGALLRADAESVNRFGLRMVAYRVRVIGGNLRRQPLQPTGSRWIVTAPARGRWNARGASS